MIGDGKLAQLIARVLLRAARAVAGDDDRQARRATAPGASCGYRDERVTSPRARRADAFTLTVEATGSPSGLALAQEITAPRGTLVLKSTFHGAANVETWPIVVKELTVIGSRCGPFPQALALLRSGRVDPRPLISRVFPLKDATQAVRYAQAARRDEGALAARACRKREEPSVTGQRCIAEKKNCPPEMRAASTKPTAAKCCGLVEASRSRVLRDGEGTLFAN